MHAGLTTRYRAKNLYKSIIVLSRSRDTEFMKRLESLLKIAGMNFAGLKMQNKGFVPGRQNR